MPIETVLEILVLVIGFYMAWNIGANDVSNAMGTSVGSGALTLKKAVLIAAVLEFSGAFFAGANVSETMQHGLIKTELFSPDPLILILGMCAALCGTSLWLQISSYFGWPVSTTHAIVGAILGFGGVIGGFEAIRWSEIGSIVLSWALAPLFSALISYLIFSLLQNKILHAINPVGASKKWIPFLVFIVLGTFSLSLIFHGLNNFNLHFSLFQALGIAAGVGFIACALAAFFVSRLPQPQLEPGLSLSRHSPQTVISLEKAMKHLRRVHVNSFDATHSQIGQMLQEIKVLSDELRKETYFSDTSSEYHTVEKMFVYLQILSACFVAFAHGSNDVANAIGPIAAVLDVIKHGTVSNMTTIPPWLLAFGGVGIVVGLATWGWRVIETVGKKITELTPTRGFCAEFGAALTILIASKCGMPVSTTHCLVGSILGVGLARGLRALNLSILKEIVLSWIITIPASAIMSILFFYFLKALFVV